MIALVECGFPGNQNVSSKFINIREPLGKHRTNYILKNSWLYDVICVLYLNPASPCTCKYTVYNSSTRLPGECPMASREDVGTLPNLASALQPQVLHAGLWVSFGQVISGNINFGILSKLHWTCCSDVSNQHDSHKDVNCFDCSDVAEKKKAVARYNQINIYWSIYWPYTYMA